MKKLQLRFKTSAGKNRDLALNFVNENLSADTVKSAMEKIIASKLFQKDGVQLYAEANTAKYIDRQEFPIF